MSKAKAVSSEVTVDTPAWVIPRERGNPAVECQCQICRRDRLVYCLEAICDWGVVNITGQPGDVVESLVRLGYTVTTQPCLKYPGDVLIVARETVTQSN